MEPETFRMELQDKMVVFVKEIAPQLLIPDILYAWIDYDRLFLILKRIERSILRDVWILLSLS